MRTRGNVARTLVGAMCMIGASLVASGQESEPEATKEPGFRVESNQIDAGEVTAGADIVANFIFHNDTEEDVQIIRAKPS